MRKRKEKIKNTKENDVPIIGKKKSVKKAIEDLNERTELPQNWVLL